MYYNTFYCTISYLVKYRIQYCRKRSKNQRYLVNQRKKLCYQDFFFFLTLGRLAAGGPPTPLSDLL